MVDAELARENDRVVLQWNLYSSFSLYCTGMEEKVEEDRKIKKKKKDDLLLPPAKKPFHSNATNHYAIDDFNDDR